MNLVKCVVFSRASQMTQIKNMPTVQEMQGMWVQALGQKDPLEEGMATPVFSPGEFHGQRSLQTAIHRVAQS